MRTLGLEEKEEGELVGSQGPSENKLRLESSWLSRFILHYL